MTQGVPRQSARQTRNPWGGGRQSRERAITPPKSPTALRRRRRASSQGWTAGTTARRSWEGRPFGSPGAGSWREEFGYERFPNGSDYRAPLVCDLSVLAVTWWLFIGYPLGKAAPGMRCGPWPRPALARSSSRRGSRQTHIVRRRGRLAVTPSPTQTEAFERNAATSGSSPACGEPRRDTPDLVGELRGVTTNESSRLRASVVLSGLRGAWPEERA